MLIVSIDIQDRFINDQVGEFSHIDIAQRPGWKLGNYGNHGINGNGSQTRELQILPIKIQKDKHNSEFDKIWEEKTEK